MMKNSEVLINFAPLQKLLKAHLIIADNCFSNLIRGLKNSYFLVKKLCNILILHKNHLSLPSSRKSFDLNFTKKKFFFAQRLSYKKSEGSVVVSSKYYLRYCNKAHVSEGNFFNNLSPKCKIH
jgi:hypothetical protein